MTLRHAATRTLVFAVCVLVLASPCAAIERDKLQEFFVAPYSVGERDGELPIWPIFKRTPSRDELIAYVFELTDFEPAPESPHAKIRRLVAIRPTGEFLEVQAFGVEPPPLWNWFRKMPTFDFIRRDQAGASRHEAGAALGASPHETIERSRDFVRARLSLMAESPGKPFPDGAPAGGAHSAATGTVLTALAISLILFVAALSQWRSLDRSAARDQLKGDHAGRSPAFPEFDT